MHDTTLNSTSDSLNTQPAKEATMTNESTTKTEASIETPKPINCFCVQHDTMTPIDTYAADTHTIPT